MSTAAAFTDIPGYTAGAWAIDPVHSDISFTVRHMMVSKVRGHFRAFSGQIVTAEDPLASSVTTTIDIASLDTGNEQRDGHVRSADFLDVATYPTMTYRSTGVAPDDGGWLVDGELSLHGVTRPVQLRLEFNGFVTDPWAGVRRAGFSATAQISRRDFGIDIAMPMDGGGVVVGDRIQVALEIEAVLNP
ncbi:MAG: YceI family protein [Egibacteraceae bacterium]